MHDQNYKRLLGSRVWRRLRATYLNQHPLCESCEAAGKTRLASEVHHIRPISNETTYEGMRRLAYDSNNLRALCHECHEAQHKQMNSRNPEKIYERNVKIVNDFFSTWLGVGTKTGGL